MKNTSVSLILLLFSNAAFAGASDCDWSKGITPGPNNTFIYSSDCNLAVGQLVQNSKVATQQISDLNQAISLKDLALTKADQRTQLWMDTSDQMQDRLNKVDELKAKNEWLFFGLGVVATSLSVLVAAKAIGH